MKFRTRLRRQSFAVIVKQFGGLLTMTYCERKYQRVAAIAPGVRFEHEAAPLRPGQFGAAVASAINGHAHAERQHVVGAELCRIGRCHIYCTLKSG